MNPHAKILGAQLTAISTWSKPFWINGHSFGTKIGNNIDTPMCVRYIVFTFRQAKNILLDRECFLRYIFMAILSPEKCFDVYIYKRHIKRLVFLQAIFNYILMTILPENIPFMSYTHNVWPSFFLPCSDTSLYDQTRKLVWLYPRDKSSPFNTYPYKSMLRENA